MNRPTTEAEIQARKAEALKLIKRKSMYSSVAAIVPIPGLDVTTDMKLMSDIINDINELFGLSHKDVQKLPDSLKKKVLIMATSAGSEFIGRRVTKTIIGIFFRSTAKKQVAKQSKYIPFIGQAVAGGISYYMMKKMGEDHIEKCVNVSRRLIS